ncbi:hypothetical protein HaLaN_11157 [Haematococcus lacustris]|uniref:Uncharacterized protein n=1 Tax=Haematococcus lacustris TaxID=44745 RepID=A0A699Z6Z9_HAELA|nr:hypothetical protein HaLaN_11157 [Haematococcus lacustris]
MTLAFRAVGRRCCALIIERTCMVLLAHWEGKGFYDRDVSAALNIRRCAVGPGPRPTELCYWGGRPAMPKRGRPGQEWVYLPDNALLRKWRRKWQR